MPDADDPREKSEVYHAVGRVAGLVALAAAIIWLLPWVYSYSLNLKRSLPNEERKRIYLPRERR